MVRGTRALVLAAGLASSSAAVAQEMSKAEFKAAKQVIAAEYKSARADCKPLAGNAKDICMAKANGRERVARADLDARFRPSATADFRLRVARADAEYSIAREACDDRSRNLKDSCLKEAKSAEMAAKADARARLERS